MREQDRFEMHLGIDRFEMHLGIWEDVGGEVRRVVGQRGWALIAGEGCELKKFRR